MLLCATFTPNFMLFKKGFCMRSMHYILLLCLVCTSVAQANEFGDWLNEKLAKINIVVKKVGANELAEYQSVFNTVKVQEAGNLTKAYNRFSGFEECFALVGDSSTIPFSEVGKNKLCILRNDISTVWLEELKTKKNMLTDEAFKFARHPLNSQE